MINKLLPLLLTASILSANEPRVVKLTPPKISQETMRT